MGGKARSQKLTMKKSSLHTELSLHAELSA